MIDFDSAWRQTVARDFALRLERNIVTAIMGGAVTETAAEPTLTAEKVREAIALVAREALPGYPLLEIRASAYWPREHVGDEVYSYKGHRFWQWFFPTILRRPVPVTMERGRKIMRDRDPVLYQGRYLFCSLQQRREIERRST